MGDSGGRITVFRDTPDAVVLRFSDFQPADRPGFSARTLSFDKSEDLVHLRQAYVRLTVDGKSEEFWMPCSSPEGGVPEQLTKKTVAGKGRQVVVSFAPNRSAWAIRSISARRGASWIREPRQASFYGSEIDLVPSPTLLANYPGKQPRKYENLLVTLNAPLDFVDPASAGAVVPHVPVVHESEQSRRR